MAESHPAGGPLQAAIDSESDNESGTEQVDQTDGASAPPSDPTAAKKKKKKKSKRSKITSVLTGSTSSDSTSKPKVSQANIDSLLEMNPSLRGEFSGLSPSQAQTLIQSMDASQLLTGLTMNPKNQKDMASYKFWQTQPVPRLDEARQSSSTTTVTPDGPIKEVIPSKVPRDPAPLPDSYEWCVLDLTSPAEIKEVYTLLTHHYVEDDNAMFRFSYSESFLDWALKSPDWKKAWHIGVRAKGPSKLLVATIFGIPTKLRVRENVLNVVEINFLCIHKKLRAKRLAPVLIKEITRRCHLEGVYQAVYTAGVVLPTPVGTCRYYHRSLDWLKLYEVEFSPLPPGRSKSQMVARNALPANTSTKGWREMEVGDIDAVLDLLGRYLKRFDLAQEFTREEIEHWFISVQKGEERVVWAFVVEDEMTGKITDLVSFYCLESSVIGEKSKMHEKVRAAYLFYYATEAAFASEERGLKERLLGLIGDGLIEAKKVTLSMRLGRKLQC
jgi:glycylpeptide N-tetradecanoyltransferase